MVGKGYKAATDVVAAGIASALDAPAAAATGGLVKGGKSSEASSSGKPADGGEAVIDMMKRLNLTPKEAEPLILDDEGDADLPGPEWALIGKVLSPNTLHVNTISAVVRPAWGNPKGLVIRPMGPNLFLAEFQSEADKVRVAKGGPWCLSRHAILLKDYDVKIQPEDVVFNELTVWARIMKLGYELMNAERGGPLAARLGNVEHLDVDEKGRAWGSYLRVQVTIDATEPIMRCVSVFSKKKNATMQYEIMYEKLPLYCFSCGLLGHSSLLCPTPAERDSEGKLPYSGDKLLVPERKKEASTSTEHSTTKSSRQGTGGSSSQASAQLYGRKKNSDGTGVVTSPSKEPSRTRRAATTKKNVVSEVGKLQLSPEMDRATRRKRKSIRQAYVPKALLVGTAAVDAGTLVVAGGQTSAAQQGDKVDRTGEESSDDPNKKQRVNNSRSADLAAAVNQPRHSQ
jgi:hypothetical protein